MELNKIILLQAEIRIMEKGLYKEICRNPPNKKSIEKMRKILIKLIKKMQKEITKERENIKI